MHAGEQECDAWLQPLYTSTVSCLLLNLHLEEGWFDWLAKTWSSPLLERRHIFIFEQKHQKS
jgi:hypothetical protein